MVNNADFCAVFIRGFRVYESSYVILGRRLLWNGILTIKYDLCIMQSHFIIFDLESTCWKLKKPPRKEIIEIGAIRVDEMGRELSVFNAFVRPIITPKLSNFCKKLTGIRQEEVDRANTFDEVILDFEDWLFEHDANLILASWGDYDLKQFALDADYHGLTFDWLKQHICLNDQHARFHQLRQPLSVSNALAADGLSFRGDTHRAIDDAQNTVEIFRHHLGKWKYSKEDFTQVPSYSTFRF